MSRDFSGTPFWFFASPIIFRRCEVSIWYFCCTSIFTAIILHLESMSPCVTVTHALHSSMSSHLHRSLAFFVVIIPVLSYRCCFVMIPIPSCPPLSTTLLLSFFPCSIVLFSRYVLITTIATSVFCKVVTTLPVAFLSLSSSLLAALVASLRRYYPALADAHVPAELHFSIFFFLFRHTGF